jgi:hypothetical protein
VALFDTGFVMEPSVLVVVEIPPATPLQLDKVRPSVGAVAPHASSWRRDGAGAFCRNMEIKMRRALQHVK